MQSYSYSMYCYQLLLIFTVSHSWPKKKKKKGLLPWLWRQIYYQLTLPDEYQLTPNVSPTCFFNLLIIYSLKNSSLRRGDIHIGKLFCWSLFTKVKSVQHKIVRAFLIQIIYFCGVIVLRDYHRLKNFGLKGLLKVTLFNLLLTAGLTSKLDCMLLWTLPSFKYLQGWEIP